MVTSVPIAKVGSIKLNTLHDTRTGNEQAMSAKVVSDIAKLLFSAKRPIVANAWRPNFLRGQTPRGRIWKRWQLRWLYVGITPVDGTEPRPRDVVNLPESACPRNGAPGYGVKCLIYNGFTSHQKQAHPF